MSTLSIQQAAEKAANLGRQFKAVIEVGEFLQEVVSLEQLATEANAKAEKATAETQGVIAEYDKQNARLSAVTQAVADAEAVLSEMRAEAKEVERGAAEAAAKVKAVAAAEAQQIRDTVANHQRKVEDQIASAKRQHEETLAVYAKEQSAAADATNKVKAELAAVKARLG
jgi:hypothetical protein